MSERRKPRICEVCFEVYEPTYSRQRTCGRVCGVELRRSTGTFRTKDERTRMAEAARDRYRTQQKMRRSVHRTVAWVRERAHLSYKRSYAKSKEAWYRAAYKRRALLKGAEYEYIGRHRVFDRDGWRCRSCGVRVRDDVQRGHPQKAILAHVQALAAGGSHTWDNVCCLCHRCNTRDGVNQLPLQKIFHFGVAR